MEPHACGLQKEKRPLCESDVGTVMRQDSPSGRVPAAEEFFE